MLSFDYGFFKMAFVLFMRLGEAEFAYSVFSHHLDLLSDSVYCLYGEVNLLKEEKKFLKTSKKENIDEIIEETMFFILMKIISNH